jgi:hypothetical protein
VRRTGVYGERAGVEGFRIPRSAQGLGVLSAADIAEGFGRLRPGDFARFLEIARASLVETRNHLVDGRDRGYLAEPLYSRLQNLARAASNATTKLMLTKKREAERLKRPPRPRPR